MNFNVIAPFYDFLASVVFLGAIKRSQIHGLKAIPPHGEVLIVGGGSGWIIEHIFEGKQMERLYYLESSSKMLARAQKRLPGEFKGRVEFINGDESSIPDRKFDAIITNYLLDCFMEIRLELIMDQLEGHLKPHGLWYFADFRVDGVGYRKLWQVPLAWLMIKFFQVTVNLESKRLINFASKFESRGFQVRWQSDFAGRFIRSTIFQKSSHA